MGATEEINHDLENVVLDGIRFLESLTRYYGADRGQEIWHSMGEVLGKEVQGQIFFRMLTGESSTRVTIQKGRAENAVWAIKAIRAGTGLGLKDAKDAWDQSHTRKVILSTTDHQAKKEMMRTLRDMGMIVG